MLAELPEARGPRGCSMLRAAFRAPAGRTAPLNFSVNAHHLAPRAQSRFNLLRETSPACASAAPSLAGQPP
eukprot:1608966-Alexandrium_andersonii.AAC.1